jgi:hypothetical protein
MVTLDLDKKGYYLVGWKKFYNKSEAVTYATKNSFEVRWMFNDSVYSKIDWSAIVESSITELYQKRILQLREQYDHLFLCYNEDTILNSIVSDNIEIVTSILDVNKSDKLADINKKAAYIVVNKPKVHFYGNEYYCYFTDNMIDYIKIDNLSIDLFYCVHSIPELIVKYIQSIKETCTLNSDLRQNLIRTLKDNWSSTTHYKFYKI